MTIPVPTLSSSGWVTEISEKADRLMSYFFVSEASQSLVYAGRISSLPEIIQLHGHDELQLEAAMRDVLRTYLERYFTAVDITVKATIPGSSDDNRIQISTQITVYENSLNYEVGHLIEVLNSTIQSIVKANNG